MKQLTHNDKVTLQLYKECIAKEPSETEIEIGEDIDGNTYKYLSIDTILNKLDTIYDVVQYIINSTEKYNLGSKSHVSVLVLHPAFDEFFRYDGIAFTDINISVPGPYKGSTKYETVNSEKMGLPLSVTEAIKNAVKRIGPAFGRNLNKGEDKPKELSPSEPTKEPTSAETKAETDRLLNQANELKAKKQSGKIVKK